MHIIETTRNKIKQSLKLQIVERIPGTCEGEPLVVVKT